MNPHERRRRGVGIALSTAVFLSLVLSTTAIVVYGAGCAQRRALEQLFARRALIGAARSAFEEVAARLEAAHADLPLLDPEEVKVAPRDLSTILKIPDQLEPRLARAELAPLGVAIAPVRLRASRWEILARDAAGGVEVEEVGVLELCVDVELGARRATVTARRHMTASPGDGGLHLHVSAADMLLTVRAR